MFNPVGAIFILSVTYGAIQVKTLWAFRKAYIEGKFKLSKNYLGNFNALLPYKSALK